MAEGLSHLHDSHDRCINLILTVLENSLLGRLLLLRLEHVPINLILNVPINSEPIAYRLFQLDLIDLNSE